jgi:hypothetical protein
MIGIVLKRSYRVAQVLFSFGFCLPQEIIKILSTVFAKRHQVQDFFLANSNDCMRLRIDNSCKCLNAMSLSVKVDLLRTSSTGRSKSPNLTYLVYSREFQST